MLRLLLADLRRHAGTWAWTCVITLVAGACVSGQLRILHGALDSAAKATGVTPQGVPRSTDMLHAARLMSGFIIALIVLAAVPAVAYALLAAEPLTGGADGPARTVVRGLVLAVIVTPTIASGAREVFARVPSALVEASLALGATRWEMIRQVVLPSCARALRSMTALALSRALAEALALTVLLGGVRPDQLRAIPARAASRSDAVPAASAPGAVPRRSGPTALMLTSPVRGCRRPGRRGRRCRRPGPGSRSA